MMTVDVLQALFGKSRNEIYADHVLATRRQHLPLCSTVCTATNETPHGTFLVSVDNPILVPAIPGPVYMRRQVRANKTKPLVDEVGMLRTNPHYAHVRYLGDRETTVATKHLAPLGQTKLLLALNML